jgi:N-acetylglucosamine kinase-like BadF-type ATPase
LVLPNTLLEQARRLGFTMHHFVVGVDFGGTNIKAGVCDEVGQLLSFIKRPTLRHEGETSVINRIIDVIEQAVGKVNYLAIKWLVFRLVHVVWWTLIMDASFRLL